MAFSLNEFRQNLANGGYRVFGHPVDFEHNVFDEFVTAEDLVLLERIHSHLPAIIERVEKEIRAHEPADSCWLPHASERSIYFEEPELREAPDDWTFALCADNHSSFQWLLEFRGLEFREISAAT